MYTVVMVAVLALVALLVAWVVNGMVGWLSGERPRDTGRLWADIFLRFFTVLELGWIGRLLNRVGLDGWPGRFVAAIGMICLAIYLFKGCERRASGHYRTIHINPPVQTD